MQLLIALLPNILTVVTVILFLALFLHINRRVGSLRRRVGTCETRIEIETAQLTIGVNTLKRGFQDMERDRPADGTIPNVSVGGSDSLRNKVLKMHRLGQSAESIADALRVPRGEVDLVVNVHQMLGPYQAQSEAV